jgi:hypothetical protein
MRGRDRPADDIRAQRGCQHRPNRTVAPEVTTLKIVSGINTYERRGPRSRTEAEVLGGHLPGKGAVKRRPRK